MNDDPLKKRLGALTVPSPDPAATERALHRATVALRNRDHAPASPSTLRRFTPGGRYWAVGVAAACLLFLTVIFSLTRPPGATPSAQRELLAQMEALFPGQLGAIIERGDEVHIELADSPGPISDQPVMVTFRKFGKAIRVLSYSGRKVCLQLAGKDVSFESLVTENGEVILAGEDFVWTDDERVRVGGYRVRAAALGGPL